MPKERITEPKGSPKVITGVLELPEKWSIKSLAAWMQVPERTLNTMLRKAAVTVSEKTFRECVVAAIRFYASASERFDQGKSANEARITAARANKEEREEALAAGELCWKTEVVAGYDDAFAKLAAVIRNFDGMSQSAKERLSVELGKVKFVKPAVATP